MENHQVIQTHQEFRSAFVTSAQRRAFLLNCARQGLRHIRQTWPTYNIRMFVFGSTANPTAKVLASSDLDIAVGGLDHIAPKSHQCAALIMRAFKDGLSEANQSVPVDVITFDPDKPTSVISAEVLRHGIEIELEKRKD